MSQALDLLENAAAGNPQWRPVAEDLAAAILARRDVRLALTVAGGGDFMLARAIELATLVLDADLAMRELGEYAGEETA